MTRTSFDAHRRGVQDADQRATPLIRMGRFRPDEPLYIKAEFLHPSGSAYDRIARPLMTADGGDTPIVAGAGSVCLAFSRAAALLGRSLVAVCPESTLPEHLQLLRQHTARLITTPAAEGLVGADEAARNVAEETGERLLFSVRQHEAARKIFAGTLGAELVDAFGRLDPTPGVVVAPVAAGALLGGLADALRSAGHTPRYLGTVRPSSESLQDGTVAPGEVERDEMELVQVSDREAFETRMQLARTEGVLVGMGSAAAVRVAAEQPGTVIAICVDAGDRYFSVDRRFA